MGPLVYLEPDTAPERTGVYYLVLDRPQARNAISRQLLAELLCCLETVRAAIEAAPSGAPAEQPLPRVLILRASAQGKAFCAGADLKERATMTEPEVAAFLTGLRLMLEQLEALPIPTLAAIDGPALGGGLEMALACDFRVAASHVTAIGFPEVKLGIIPGAGGTQRAPRVVGMQRAKELIYTGRQLTAKQALELGLIDHVSRGDSASCLALCGTLAEQMIGAAPLALRAAKMAISAGFGRDLSSGLDLEWSFYQPLLDTLDRQEALDAFRERRKPVFLGK